MIKSRRNIFCFGFLGILLSGCGFRLKSGDTIIHLPKEIKLSISDPLSRFSKLIKNKLHDYGVNIVDNDPAFILKIFEPKKTLNSLGPVINGEQMELTTSLSYVLEKNDNSVAIPITKVRSELIFVNKTDSKPNIEKNRISEISKNLELELIEKFFYSFSSRYSDFANKADDAS